MSSPITAALRRGEVYRLDFAPATGREMTGVHPCVIVQNDVGNQHSALTIVAAVTSNMRVASLPVGVLLNAGRVAWDTMRSSLAALVGFQKEISMSIELSEENLEAVAKGEPFRFTALKTNIEFVVLSADVYDRVKELFAGDDVDLETMYPLLADIAPEDWEDPSVYGRSPKP